MAKRDFNNCKRRAVRRALKKGLPASLGARNLTKYCWGDGVGRVSKKLEYKGDQRRYKNAI